MTKYIAILAAAFALGACSNMMSGSSAMGNKSETKNSTDSEAAKSGNGAAVSPGGGAK